MPRNSDKRKRGDLDLFVPGLIDGGVATPYELQQSAGLSPAATIPALRRLLQAGVVRQGKPGIRSRTVHRITATGTRHLKSGWKELIEGGPGGDLDADLRAALLALFVGGDRAAASDFLLDAADLRTPASAEKGNGDDSSGVPPLALWYRKRHKGSRLPFAMVWERKVKRP